MKKNITILEDNKQVAKELYSLLHLEINDWSFNLFRKTENAMEYLMNHNTDLIIIDLKLDSDREEEYSGLYFARQIGHMKKFDDIPIILISPKAKIWDIQGEISFFTFLNFSQNSAGFVTILKKLLRDEVVEKWITLQIHGSSQKFNAKDIVYGEIFNRMFSLQTKIEMISIPYLSMKEFIQKIPDYPIYQCHRSYAVNINFIKAVNCSENIIVLEDPYGTVELGKSYKKFILQKFEKGT